MGKTFTSILAIFINLSLGILAIVEVYKSNFWVASVLIIFAFLFQICTKPAAATNELNKSLDSLANLISFGIAPSILLFFKYASFNFGYIKLLIFFFLVIYISSGAYTLAKYNINKYYESFEGISVNFAGLVIAVYSMCTTRSNIYTFFAMGLLALLACLMFSELKLKKGNLK
jgi:CDP-diacylglycerol--serine O-phosphatidyltransferase